MKLTLLATLLAFTFFSCTRTPEQKACLAIEKYMKEILDDPSSYQPGQFQCEAIYALSPEYQKEKDSVAKLFRANKLSVREFAMNDSIVEAKYDQRMISGWNVTHAYRAKNKFGALVGDEAEFYVDKDYHVRLKE